MKKKTEKVKTILNELVETASELGVMVGQERFDEIQKKQEKVFTLQNRILFEIEGTRHD